MKTAGEVVAVGDLVRLETHEGAWRLAQLPAVGGALVALDPELVTPASTNYVDAARTIPLFNAKMECASCHSTHDNTFSKCLRISNAGSALCLKCHLK